MTSKQAFEYALVELNKIQAPSLLLEDYNYFFNKAVNQFINRMYNAYDMNQQKSDDLRVLKGTALLTPNLASNAASTSSLFSKTYEVNLPDDYLHILNCVVEYKLLKTYKCYNVNDTWQQGAKRLTADMFSQIINNYYLRPSYKNPYFYINNVNTSNTYPTGDTQNAINRTLFLECTIRNNVTILDNSVLTINETNIIFGSTENVEIGLTGKDTIYNLYRYLIESSDPQLRKITYSLSNINSTVAEIKLIFDGNAADQEIVSSDVTISVGNSYKVYSEIDKIPQVRYGNASKVRMEIRYGKDNAVFQLQNIFIDYLKAPQFIRLTQDQVDEVDDNSQILEFPDYVCQEIVNELIKLLMENASDPRLQNNIPINQSIASPQQEQAQTKKR